MKHTLLLLLIALLGEIGRSHSGRTPAQVALNWVICKGALPIPGAKNALQARENAGALGWRLASEEVAALDGRRQADGRNGVLKLIFLMKRKPA